MEIKHLQESEIKYCLSVNYKCNSSPVDIYAENEKEVIFLSDGVCVSEQKIKRDKVQKQGKERTTTDIMMLQTDINDKSSYTTIIAAEGINTVDLVQSELLKAYGERIRFLPIVSISDGARSIKNQNKEIFGAQVIHILDWYHLQQKVIQLMSQIAINKSSKEEYIKLINNYLWSGNVISAVLVLKFMETKNKTKTAELVGYLEKNADHIINYERRKNVGKIIGSGRTEKQNDCIVSKRQKRKGMSWSSNGSRNLAILTAYHKMAA
jgi:predicted ATP-grasp superfamily ATP-dependent carboligase